MEADLIPPTPIDESPREKHKTITWKVVEGSHCAVETLQKGGLARGIMVVSHNRIVP